MRLMRIVHAREAAKLEVVLASDNEYSLEQFKTCGHMRVAHAGADHHEGEYRRKVRSLVD